MQPAQMTLNFGEFTIGGSDIMYNTIDISQCVSLVNRRFYRQGREWAVGGIRLVSDKRTEMNIYALPTTWVLANAYTKAYKVWQKWQHEFWENSPGVKPTYRDFKIYFDDNHHDGSTAAYAPNLKPYGHYTPGVDVAYDWDYSTLVLPNQDPDNAYDQDGVHRCSMHMIGGDTATGSNKSLGIIKGYADSRARPSHDSPNMPADISWMHSLFDEGDDLEAVEAELTNEGDDTPYYIGKSRSVSEVYPGGGVVANNFIHYEVVSGIAQSTNSTDTSGELNLPGFSAPCGLVRLKISNLENTTATCRFQVFLVPGDYRGYAARPMKELN